MRPPEIITDQAALEAHCCAWREAGVFAFDTEFIRDDTYDAALCLVQVTTDGEVALIDPTADVDVGVFWELVADESIVTVVHAGKEDFEVCLRKTGKVPRNVFDVQIAAGFAGYGYPLSLVRLVESLLHRRISKGQTLTDWLRRPLTAAQVRYAVEDVVYLPDAYRKLREDIDRAGRSGWAAEELKCFEDAEFYRAPAEERTLRLKGSKKLDGLGLAVLARLIEWRDRWAQTRNRPIRALMRDDVLVEIRAPSPAPGDRSGSHARLPPGPQPGGDPRAARSDRRSREDAAERMAATRRAPRRHTDGRGRTGPALRHYAGHLPRRETQP